MSGSLRRTHLLRGQTTMMSVVLLLSIMVKADQEKTSCLVPDDVHLLSLLIENGGVVLSPPGNEGDVEPRRSVQDIHIFNPTSLLGDTPSDLDCPVGEKSPQDGAVNEIATCPWRYVVDRDPHRYPVSVSHAVNRCGACLDQHGALIEGTRCEPVPYLTKVLRQRGCDQRGGIMQYDVEDLEQIVAFQCTIIPKRLNERI
ncbi:uncharacterized protein LOC110979728 [Acanthaster planci]|uniref:Uncharacterized protein LOC110979728 n=1 Tax=Acanthaster planci TaxID=133434 RepID=A0A8B7YDZ1_ACAPL|nr:uncharacterized protein LOC110979728 [Acanthaster planci]